MSFAEESHPGISVEAHYMEAVLAYNKRKMDEALKILNQLLKAYPNNVEALELKALTLKSKGDDEQSLDTYNRLIKLKPMKDRGPYYFEAGVIYNKQKKNDVAKGHFEKAIQLKFNVEAANLFLGLINFGNNDFGQAEGNFDVIRSKGTPELKVVGHYYLGMIHFKSGNPAAGTSELVEARDLANTIPESKIASDIKTGVNKILVPFTKSTWFANATAMGQYDNNISSLPTSITNPAITSGKATPKLMLMGGVGRMTAPLSTIQWVPSYRLAYNRNFNAETRGYEFFTNTLSMYFNYKPLSQVSGGIKTDGNFTFQNQTEDGATYTFRKYNLAGELGPFLKFPLGSNARMDWEGYVRPQKVFSSADLSGLSFFTRMSVRGVDSSSNFFNPVAGVSFEKSNVAGNAYKYQSYTGSLSNTLRVPGGYILTPSVDYMAITYALADPVRSDKMITARTSLIKMLSAQWTINGDVTYIINNSNLTDTYSYNRIMAGLGITRAF